MQMAALRLGRGRRAGATGGRRSCRLPEAGNAVLEELDLTVRLAELAFEGPALFVERLPCFGKLFHGFLIGGRGGGLAGGSGRGRPRGFQSGAERSLGGLEARDGAQAGHQAPFKVFVLLRSRCRRRGGRVVLGAKGLVLAAGLVVEHLKKVEPFLTHAGGKKQECRGKQRPVVFHGAGLRVGGQWPTSMPIAAGISTGTGERRGELRIADCRFGLPPEYCNLIKGVST